MTRALPHVPAALLAATAALLVLAACDRDSASAPAGASVSPRASAAAIAAGPRTPAADDGRFSIRVAGNQLVDASGKAVQLRGVNVSGLEFVAIQGWNPTNPWGGQTGTDTPQWNTLKTWGINAVRLPLNEASWLGLSCVSVGGSGAVVVDGAKVENKRGGTVKADPGGNYVATVKSSVAGATEAGLYVILDLHWSAPGEVCPMTQNAMADADHSLDFWSSVATAFREYPSVLFELFNEPTLPSKRANWTILRDGGMQDAVLTGGDPFQVSFGWQVAGMQQMLDAVRATGAKNVVLVAGLNYAGDLSRWLDYRPVDSLQQLGAVWHSYPTYHSVWGTAGYLIPNAGLSTWSDAEQILAAGFPLVVTEYGDRNTPGTVGAPFVSHLLPWADRNGVGYLGWAWAVAQNPDNVLITNSAGDPTSGYGEYVLAHYRCRAKGTAECP
jgi:hypothetical protein